MFQKFNTHVGYAQRSTEDKSADGVRRNNYRDEGQEGIVDERAAVNGNLVEAKKEGHRRSHDCVQAEEWREGNEYADRKSKRRSLRWIIQREQTAKGRAKHLKPVTSEK